MSDISVMIASDVKQQTDAMMVRAAVYCGELGYPIRDEFDGSDPSAASVIAYKGDEPVGTMRIRFFGDHARIERLAVLASHRSLRLSMAVVRKGKDFCWAKGFSTLRGYSQTSVMKFWQRMGFEQDPMYPDPVPFSKDDTAPYYAVVARLDLESNRNAAWTVTGSDPIWLTNAPEPALLTMDLPSARRRSSHPRVSEGAHG